MPAPIVLVACTSWKAVSAQPPRALYTSPWFRDAARYAAQLVGLLRPADTVILLGGSAAATRCAPISRR